MGDTGFYEDTETQNVAPASVLCDIPARQMDHTSLCWRENRSEFCNSDVWESCAYKRGKWLGFLSIEHAPILTSTLCILVSFARYLNFICHLFFYKTSLNSKSLLPCVMLKMKWGINTLKSGSVVIRLKDPIMYKVPVPVSTIFACVLYLQNTNDSIFRN